MIGQGYILEDISDQELTDGVWYRVSREEKWTTTMPDTFSALYVRTVGEQTISAEALQSVVARLGARDARFQHGRLCFRRIPCLAGR